MLRSFWYTNGLYDYAFTIHGKQHEYKKELKVNITFIIGIVRDKHKTLYHW